MGLQSRDLSLSNYFSPLSSSFYFQQLPDAPQILSINPYFIFLSVMLISLLPLPPPFSFFLISLTAFSLFYRIVISYTYSSLVDGLFCFVG